jgi:NAD(P)-dependent dehydrogenase (short-subunit alcohol dehydrogenase family)
MLIDITLAGGSGFELAQRLAEQRRGAAVVILISTHPQADFADLIDEAPRRGSFRSQSRRRTRFARSRAECLAPTFGEGSPAIG